MTGATFRQIDYWSRIGILVPEGRPTSAGIGVPRRWSAELVPLVVELRELFAFRHEPVAVALERLRALKAECAETPAT